MQRKSLFIFRPTMGQGGADRVTLILLQNLDRRVFDLSLVLFRAEGEYMIDIPADVTVYSLGAASIWQAWLPSARLLRRHKPDIVFSTSSGTNMSATIAHLIALRKGRLVLSERNILFHSGLTAKRRLVVWLKQMLYGRADLITVLSECMREDVVTRLGIDRERIMVVYNPVVSDNLRRRAQEPVDHPWFEDGTPVVLAAGRLVAQKDFETLLRAFKLVREQREARLFILGEGPLREKLLSLAKELGLEDDVLLPGFDRNPFKYMAWCSLFVLSSIHEGLPNVLIQAMACGAPVIATDCPCGPSEIIDEPGVNGLLVPVGGVEVLADRMGYLLDHPEVSRKMGEKGQQSTGRFRIDIIIKNYAAAILGSQPGA